MLSGVIVEAASRGCNKRPVVGEHLHGDWGRFVAARIYGKHVPRPGGECVAYRGHLSTRRRGDE